MLISIIRSAIMFTVFIMAMWMLYSGMMKLVPFPGMEESFMAWGYDKWFMQVIGVLEIILAVAVFAKPTRNYAFVALMLLMTGALYTHLVNYEYEETGPAMWILIGSLMMLAYDKLNGEQWLEKQLGRR